MKVKFCCDNHANIHSKKAHVFDTEKDLGYPDGDWAELTQDEKEDMVKEWAYEQFEYWIEEDEK